MPPVADSEKVGQVKNVILLLYGYVSRDITQQVVKKKSTC